MRRDGLVANLYHHRAAFIHPPFSAERDAAQYVVAIDGQGTRLRNAPGLTPPSVADAVPWPADAAVTPMTDHKGRTYECAIPPANPHADDTSAAKVRE